MIFFFFFQIEHIHVDDCFEFVDLEPEAEKI